MTAIGPRLGRKSIGHAKLTYKRRRPMKTRLKRSDNLRKADFYRLMKQQAGLCANKDCAKRNDGARQKVNSISDMCFIVPPELWEPLGYHGDPRRRSNRQLLCQTCRKIKIHEDRKRISELRRKNK